MEEERKEKKKMPADIEILECHFSLSTIGHCEELSKHDFG